MFLLLGPTTCLCLFVSVCGGPSDTIPPQILLAFFIELGIIFYWICLPARPHFSSSSFSFYRLVRLMFLFCCCWWWLCPLCSELLFWSKSAANESIEFSITDWRVGKKVLCMTSPQWMKAPAHSLAAKTNEDKSNQGNNNGSSVLSALLLCNSYVDDNGRLIVCRRTCTHNSCSMRTFLSKVLSDSLWQARSHYHAVLMNANVVAFSLFGL